MTVDVEGDRAVAIGGDPEHRFTQGFLCAKVNHYLDRVYSPERLLHPMRRVGKKGEGRFERIRLGRGARHRRDAAARDRRRARAAVDPAVLVRRQHGDARQREHGPPLLPRARGEPARPHDLLERRRRRLQGDLREDDRLRSRGRRRCAADRLLGRQHRELERAPVAVRRSGAQEGRAARDDRPVPLANRREVGPASRPLSRHGRGARARDDARDLPRRARGPRVAREVHAWATRSCASACASGRLRARPRRPA